MPIQSAKELLVRELQHIEDAENQASQALQRLSKQAENSQLRRMLDRRLKQGERLLKDVQRNLEKLDGKGRNGQNAAARGIIQEGEKLLAEVKSAEIKQAVMIAGVQKLEHYCIAAWGTVKAVARDLGEEELAQAMQRALDEGYRYDREMTELAEGRVNPEAMEAGEPSEEEESGSRQSQSRQSQTGQSDADLKEREYRGEDGQIHHHTREYMERKGR